MSNPVAAASCLGQIATRRQLEAFGFSGYDLTREVRLGNLRRVRRGWYATPDATLDQICAVRVGGRLAGLSAARSFGLYAGVDTRLHVCVPANASRLRVNVAPSVLPDDAQLTPDNAARLVVLHWLPAGRQAERQTESWRVPLPDCLRQVVSWSDRETAIACLDTAVYNRVIDSRGLARIFSGSPAADCRTVAAVRWGSQSGMESIFRQRVERMGIQVDQQLALPGVGRVDAVLGGLIVVELDGSQHNAADAVRRDKRRDAGAAALGLVPLRFSYTDVMSDWQFVETTIESTLAAAQSRNSGRYGTGVDHSGRRADIRPTSHRGS